MCARTHVTEGCGSAWTGRRLSSCCTLTWVLVTLYMGPVALLLYVLTDKEPRPGEHEQFIKPLWKQAVGSTIHCVAGDATGIILAATITALLGLPMWLDMIVEYIAGFTFGLFIFQALFMKDMLGGSYWKAVRGTFLPEWFSMNTMMAGMFPVMVILMMGRNSGYGQRRPRSALRCDLAGARAGQVADPLPYTASHHQ